MASVSIENTKTGVSRKERSRPARLAPNYWPFVIPALVVISAVIVFPWVFTLWMSVHRWTLGQEQSFIGFDNYIRLASDVRFWESLWHTLIYTVLSVVAPLFLGTLAALVFDAQFPLRGFLRGVFVMPMMATPVAIALVWTMMFHPQLGILNYLLSLVGLPPQLWVFHPATVIPSLVMVETWQWTPLVMLIVLGGLASLPTEPYESALIDGASQWQMFRHITWPLVLPFVMSWGAELVGGPACLSRMKLETEDPRLPPDLWGCAAGDPSYFCRDNRELAAHLAAAAARGSRAVVLRAEGCLPVHAFWDNRTEQMGWWRELPPPVTPPAGH